MLKLREVIFLYYNVFNMKYYGGHFDELFKFSIAAVELVNAM